LESLTIKIGLALQAQSRQRKAGQRQSFARWRRPARVRVQDFGWFWHAAADGL